MAKEDFHTRLGKHIKKLRNERNLSLRDFELENDFDRGLLSKIEGGKKDIKTSTLNKLITAFGMTWEEFFKGMK